MTKVLVISDRHSVHRLANALAVEAFDVSHCNGPQAPDGACAHGSTCSLAAEADAVVLDIDLADVHVSALMLWGRYRGMHLPIVLLTSPDAMHPWVVDLATAVLPRTTSARTLADALRRLVAGSSRRIADHARQYAPR